MYDQNTYPQSSIPGYQIRVRIIGVQPIIWRRFLLRSDNSFADLHQAIQIACNWQSKRLYRFKLNATTIGSPQTFGTWTSDSAELTRLADFMLSEDQRFIYEYSIRDSWELDIRIERHYSLDMAKFYPYCMGGNRAAPSECCGGPEQFMWLREHYSPTYLNRRMSELCTLLMESENCIADRQPAVEDVQLELDDLRDWLNSDRFDRRHVNQRLKAYAAAANERVA